MKATSLIRNTLLAGVCVGLMTGCSWLEDWPPRGSEMSSKSAPKPADSKIVRASEGSWPAPSGSASSQQVASAPMGIATDPASADRIASLEKQVEDLRNDLSMMMPALTKIAEAQGGLQKSLAQMEPAAGNGNGMAAQNQRQQRQQAAQMAQQVSPSGAQPGSVAWYEEQERMKRSQITPLAPAVNTTPTYNQASASPSMDQAYQPAAQPQYQPPVAQYQQTSYQQQQPMQQYQPQPAQYQQAGYQQAQPVQQPAQPVYQQAPASAPVSAGLAAAGGASVYNVRFGEHDDKTRMVLDTSSKVAFSYDVDNGERILMVELPGTGWQGAPQMGVDSPLVSGYSVVPDNNGGSQLIMQLKQPVQVVWAQALPPGGPQGNRVVFDLAPI